MSYEDFLANFEQLTIVHVDFNAFSHELQLSKKSKNLTWQTKSFDFEFVSCEFSDDQNPQFYVELKDPDLEDEEDKATLIVSLMQKDSIENRERNYGEYNEAKRLRNEIKFKLFKVINQQCLMNEPKGFKKSDLLYVDESG
jgi:hypothetical protein